MPRRKQENLISFWQWLRSPFAMKLFACIFHFRANSVVSSVHSSTVWRWKTRILCFVTPMSSWRDLRWRAGTPWRLWRDSSPPPKLACESQQPPNGSDLIREALFQYQSISLWILVLQYCLIERNRLLRYIKEFCGSALLGEILQSSFPVHSWRPSPASWSKR